MGVLDENAPTYKRAPQQFSVRFAGGRDESRPLGESSRWYSIDAVGVLIVVSEAPEGTTTVRYSPTAWESVTEFAPDPTHQPTGGTPVGLKGLTGPPPTTLSEPR